MGSGSVRYWCDELNCRVVVYSVYDFVDVIVDGYMVRRFAELARFAERLLDRFWDSFTSTHTGYDRLIALIRKILNISSDSSVCRLTTTKHITCYELFNLRDLEEVAELNNMFRDATKRYRRYVANLGMYVVRDALSRIQSLLVEHTVTCSRPEHLALVGDVRIHLAHKLSSKEMEIRVHAERPGKDTSYVGSIDLGRDMRRHSKRLTIAELKDVLAETVVKRATRMVAKWLRSEEADKQFVWVPALYGRQRGFAQPKADLKREASYEG